MLKKLNVTIEGVCPLMMHSGRLADPLNAYVKRLKEVSSKRKKTDEDHQAMARIEWEASLYTNDAGAAILPAELLEATIRDGAKKSKLGKQFQSAVFVEEDALLDHGGPKDVRGLFDDDRYRDTRMVRVQSARVMRTRPIFRKWKAKVGITYNPTLVNEESVRQALSDAGQQCGIGDFRPRFGRFEVV